MPLELQDLARQAVAAGARLAQRIQRRHLQDPLSKSDRSPVTLADFAVQALLGAILEERTPEIPLVAEEDSQALRHAETADRLESLVDVLAEERSDVSTPAALEWIDRGSGEPADRFWTLDPVDGTKGFLRGGQYVVALALIEAGEVTLGALGCPNLDQGGRPDLEGAGCVAWAARDTGAWIAGPDGERRRPLHVSGQRDPSLARVLRSVEESHTDPQLMDALLRSLQIRVPPVLMDSQAKYVLLAGGNAELLFRLLAPDQPHYREKIWDQAAGSLLVREAGGTVTDLHGKPLDFSAGRELGRNRGVLVSNGLLHPEALQALQAVMDSVEIPGKAQRGSSARLGEGQDQR